MGTRTQLRHYLEDRGQLLVTAAVLSGQEHHYPINMELSEHQTGLKFLKDSYGHVRRMEP
jgi:hypothetical protein